MVRVDTYEMRGSCPVQEENILGLDQQGGLVVRTLIAALLSLTTPAQKQTYQKADHALSGNDEDLCQSRRYGTGKRLLLVEADEEQRSDPNGFVHADPQWRADRHEAESKRDRAGQPADGN